jgi:hypothetical protein
MSRRRVRLQRLTRSVVVTFSAAAAGSAGCDTLSHPESAANPGGGAAGVGDVSGHAGGTPTVNPPPVMAPQVGSPGSTNPPVPLPCPITLPVDGTSCVQFFTFPAQPSSADGCLIPSADGCHGYFAKCVSGVWVVELRQLIACNPPEDAGQPIEDDAGVDDDAGLDTDA